MKTQIIQHKKTRLLQFFISGIFLGLIEDIIVISLITKEPITWSIIFIILTVAIPFAFFSEFIADHPKFWFFILPQKIKSKIDRKIKTIQIIEFFFVGVVLGVVQDVIALVVATNAKIDLITIVIIITITIPFAFLNEVIVDGPKYLKKQK